MYYILNISHSLQGPSFHWGIWYCLAEDYQKGLVSCLTNSPKKSQSWQYNFVNSASCVPDA